MTAAVWCYEASLLENDASVAWRCLAISGRGRDAAAITRWGRAAAADGVLVAARE